MNSDELNAQIDNFFTLPDADPPPSVGQISTLYLLRREMQDCMIGVVGAEEHVLQRPTRHRMFASLMVMCAGIDLLARFAARTEKRGGRERFIDFLETFAGLDREHGEMVLSYRNALMHSFGLYHEDANRAFVPLVVFQSDQQSAVVSPEGDGWSLSFDDLYEHLYQAIRAYRRALETDAMLRGRFESLYPKYGLLYVTNHRPGVVV